MSRSNYAFVNYQQNSGGYQGTGGYQGKTGGYTPTNHGGGHGLMPPESTNEIISNNTNEIISNNTNEIIESSSSEGSSSEGDSVESNLLKYAQKNGGSSSSNYTQQSSGGGSSNYTLTDYRSKGYASKSDGVGKKNKKNKNNPVQEQPLQVEQQPEPQVEQQPEPQVIPSRKQRLEKQRERERSQWHTDLKQRTTLPTIPLLPEYHGEQTNQQTGALGMVLNGKAITGTHYAHSSNEYNTDIVDGKLHRGGKTVDSTGNKVVYMKDHAGRSNYAMDGAGGFYSSGVREETDKYAGETTGKRHNHSSLVGGGDVTAAGTMVVKDGKVDLLADDSGHYHPNMTQTFEAVKHLRDQKVMGGKSKVELTGKRFGQKEFTSSVDEFMRYEDVIHQSRQKSVETGDTSHLNHPEQLLRKELGARRKLEAELKSKNFTRKNSDSDTSRRRMRSVDQLEKGLQSKQRSYFNNMEGRGKLEAELNSQSFAQKSSGSEASTRRMRSIDLLEQGLQSRQREQFKDIKAPNQPQERTLTEEDLNPSVTELPELQLDPSELQEQPLEMLNLEPEQLEEVEQEVESEDSDEGGVTDYFEKDYTPNPYAEKYLEKN